MTFDKEFFQRLISLRHPIYNRDSAQWEKWRTTYEGGGRFLDKYLQRFSKRESKQAYNDRKKVTPVSAYAQTALDRIRNSLFQRMGDIVRRDGSKKYLESVAGERGGVDRRGSTMNYFVGNTLLTELLVMGKVGVYVDAPNETGGTLATAETIKPYLYSYRREDILSWTSANPEDPNEFQALLLRDVDLSHDERTYLPSQKTLRYRWVFISPDTGKVNTMFVNEDGEPMGETVELDLTRIPFHVFDLGASLMQGICQHQVAILNIDSSNTAYNILANFPFLTEKRSGYRGGGHLRQNNADGTSSEGGQPADVEEVEIGNMTARTYAEEAPKFIAPPSDPLDISLKLREDLRNDIERLVNLSVASLGDDEGLESGLAFIANVLETGERRIATFWSAYESTDSVATVKYPERYSLKSESDRIDEASKLADLMFRVPGKSGKKELSKAILNTLFSGKMNNDTLSKILKEVDSAEYCTSDPEVIKLAHELGLVGNKLGSVALGFPEGEHLVAEQDRAKRIALTKEAQSNGELKNPASRGVDDEAAVPRAEASDEKELSRETDENETSKKPVRGEGK